MDDKIQLGHMGKYWGDDFKSLPYTKQGVTNEEIEAWEKLGYSSNHLKSYTGHMYDNSNPMPAWIERLENTFGLYKQAYTFYRMDTCEIMPPHSDHFRTYCRLNNTTPDKVWRAVMMLEDWKPGHYFELDGVGYVNWKAGDWFKWQGDIPHAASNIGSEPRYTLQVTGLSPNVGQLNKLFCFNIPNIEEDDSHPMVRLDVAPNINPFNDVHNRFMVYMNNSYIKELDTITHSIEDREILNTDGLHIYLYEPICSYDANRETPTHTQGFYSEFADIKPEDMRSDELDSIYNYVLRNELTNVTVHTGDYDVDRWYPVYKSHMKLVCDDIFIRTMKCISNIRSTPSNEFIRNFISLNWRFTKHRQLVANYLAGYDGRLSWHFKSTFDVMKKDLYFDLESWKGKYPLLYDRLVTGCELVQSNSPYYLDKRSTQAQEIVDPVNSGMWPLVEDTSPGYTPSLYNQVSNSLSNYYFETFVDVVTETRFAQPTANISEKTFQPIQYFRPFVLVAPPKSLEYLKTFGFKTFSEFWDESYDDELDHGERLAKIFDLLDSVFSMTNEEQRELYANMLPNLEHNFNRYKEIWGK